MQPKCYVLPDDWDSLSSGIVGGGINVSPLRFIRKPWNITDGMTFSNSSDKNACWLRVTHRIQPPSLFAFQCHKVNCTVPFYDSVFLVIDIQMVSCLSPVIAGCQSHHCIHYLNHFPHVSVKRSNNVHQFQSSFSYINFVRRLRIESV